MSFFLYKPHVIGPTNQITTPDVIIDRVSLCAGDHSTVVPAHRLNTSFALQTFDGSVSVTAAYALVACGGGCLMSLAALVQPAGSPVSAVDCVLSRSAWRYRNFAEHADKLTLTVRGNELQKPPTTVGLGYPNDTDPRGSEDELALPRGVAELRAMRDSAIVVPAPLDLSIELRDPLMQRSIALSLSLLPSAEDSWAERPRGRYSVGPVGDVEHYI